MTKKFDQQEKSEFVKKLRSGIKQIPDPAGRELDWDSIRTKVFDEIDTPRRKGFVYQLGDFISMCLNWLRSPVPAVAVSFASILLIIGISIIMVRVNAGHQYLTGRLIRSSGAIEYSTEAVNTTWQQVRGPVQFAHNAAMKTGASSFLLVELEQGNRFSLSGSSELILDRLEKETISFRLEYGVLSVKREWPHGSQHLTVITSHMTFEALGTVFRVEQDKGSSRTVLTVYSGAVKSLRNNGAGNSSVYQAPCKVIFQGESISQQSLMVDDQSAKAAVDSFNTGLAISMPVAQLQFVSVFSDPDGAEVFIDSIPSGQTPLIMQLPIGAHIIKLAKKGFGDSSRKIKLDKENGGQVFISLTPEKSDHADSVIPHFNSDVIVPEVHPITTQLGGLPDAGTTVIDTPAKAEITQPVGKEKTDSDAGRSRVRPEQIIAGTLLNRKLYWDIRGLELDTIQWTETYRAVTGYAPRNASWHTTMIQSKQYGKRFIELKNASAISVSVLLAKGFQVIALTQWTGKTKIRNIDPRGQFEQENMISDFSWERIDRSGISRPSGFAVDYAATLYFANGGYSTFSGKEKMNLSRVPIAAEKEFALRDNSKGITVEGNQYRLVIRLFAVAEAAKSNKEIISEIEQGMDSLKLDMSFKPPELIPVGKY
jgi:hypothetical protein